MDDVGREQARRAAATLVALRPTHIVASDLSRAHDTALELARLSGLAVRTDSDLRETFAGVWQGKTRAQIQSDWPAEFAAWGGDSNLRPGGGETRLEVAARVTAAIDRALVEVPDHGTLVVASHGGALRAALGCLLGLEPAQWTALGVLSNAQWSVLVELDEAVPRPPGLQWRLHEYNAGSLPEPAVGGDDR